MSRQPRPPGDHTLGILGGFAVFFGGMALFAWSCGVPMVVAGWIAIIALVFGLFWWAALVLGPR
jgi:hypothetical protein